MKTEIIIYGTGCSRCNTLCDNVRAAVAALGADCDIRHEENPLAISEAGILRTPTMTINGKEIVSGRVPAVAELQYLIKKEVMPVQQTAPDGGCCGGACHCGGAGKAATAPEPDSCGCGCCCGGKGSGGLGKKLVLWGALALVAVACIKIYNRTQKAQSEPAPAVAATQDSPPAATQPCAVVLTYYTYGARCVTCQRMEKWAEETVRERFADELATGRLAWRSAPAVPADIQKYGLTTKSLILGTMQEGRETGFSNLERIWELSRDEAAFKAYVEEKLRQALDKQ